ncbi:potassium channel subfamily K member 6 isoform X4 [Nothobranchius furzeri]|uniref:Potassium channel, subfamily K, member 6 n=3 Tax=Nothobranchius TaxID=28779 RepID=A0A8C6LJ21_NOTFU|nr:potassium channel subfamily K member 6 [Nothobranchius furzeri]
MECAESFSAGPGCTSPGWTHPPADVRRRRRRRRQKGGVELLSGFHTERGAGGSGAAPGLHSDMHSVGKSWLLLTGFVLFYIIYLLFGALVFSSIERPVEDKLRRDMELLKEDFLNQSCVSAASLERFLNQVLSANKYGVSVLKNSSDKSNWDLSSSMFFANTLVTTVGYGHPTPLSDAGKVFAIVYALIGVPFTMLVLTACVQRIMHPLVLAPVGVLQRSGLKPQSATAVHFLLLLLAVVLSFFVAPAAVFSLVEVSWTFLDGIYFCFISLCTIGLGDFVPANQPGQRYRVLYQVAVMVYLFTGLMMMYLLLRSFHKMADLHGLTTFLQLPRCEDSVMEEDRETIMDSNQASPHLKDKDASRPLDVRSHPTYNSINKG